MSVTHLRGTISILALVPGMLCAQAGRHESVPLKSWPTALYWQPARAEARAAAGEPEAAGTPSPQATAPPNSLVFVGMTPCRVVDTRGVAGTFSGPSLAGGATRSFPLATQSGNPCPIPANAQAYSLNVTVVPPGFLGFLTIWPQGVAQPGVSTINDSFGQVLANAAVVPAGSPNGGVSVFALNNTDLIIDINGYYTTQTGITLAAGSNSAPSLSFSGDVGTGIYSAGSGAIDIASGGTNVLAVTAGGTVGIGTTSPGAKLDVETSDPALDVIGGHNSATSGNHAGVNGSVNTSSGVGVNGFNFATSGFAIGVRGGTASNSGAGVQGNASLAGAAGVMGFNNATTGYAVGVEGHISGPNGTGVSGDSNVAGVFGVVGFNSATTGFAIGTEGASSSPGGAGLLGVDWDCSSGTFCALVPGQAVQLQTATTGVLIKGLSGAAGANNNTATQVFLVDGHGNVNMAGNLTVGGSVTKGGGSFRIDHPLDSENKYLYHSFVESPDMKNIYDGLVVLDENGEATVTLPDWFEALNQDFRYQLTSIGGYAPVYVASEVAGNQFRIAGGRLGLKVSWMLTGIRHDSYANAHRIPVEVEKPASERRTPADPGTGQPH